MEIYSPKSKNSILFKQNQFKVKQSNKTTGGNPNEIDRIFIPEAVIQNKESLFSKVKKAAMQKLKTVFEYSEETA